MTAAVLWTGIGFLGQALFSARFLVQWLRSEIRRESVIPIAFWWFSLSGGITLLAYAIYKRDPVFILGQGFGLLVYARNLYLIRSRKRAVLLAGSQPLAEADGVPVERA